VNVLNRVFFLLLAAFGSGMSKTALPFTLPTVPKAEVSSTFLFSPF
jgi:hypothetical protein